MGNIDRNDFNNQIAYDLYVTIAKGLGYADEAGNVNTVFEMFLQDVTLRKSNTFSSNIMEENNELINVGEDVKGSKHGKYVPEDKTSILEAFCSLQYEQSYMNTYNQRLSAAISRGTFANEFDNIIDEIKGALIKKDKNGKLDNPAIIDDEGILLNGNNRVLKLKMFLAMQVAAVQLDESLSDKEKANKRNALYEKYRIEVIRQREER